MSKNAHKLAKKPRSEHTYLVSLPPDVRAQLAQIARLTTWTEEEALHHAIRVLLVYALRKHGADQPPQPKPLARDLQRTTANVRHKQTMAR